MTRHVIKNIFIYVYIFISHFFTLWPSEPRRAGGRKGPQCQCPLRAQCWEPLQEACSPRPRPSLGDLTPCCFCDLSAHSQVCLPRPLLPSQQMQAHTHSHTRAHTHAHTHTGVAGLAPRRVISWVPSEGPSISPSPALKAFCGAVGSPRGPGWAQGTGPGSKAVRGSLRKLGRTRAGEAGGQGQQGRGLLGGDHLLVSEKPVTPIPCPNRLFLGAWQGLFPGAGRQVQLVWKAREDGAVLFPPT